MLLLHPSRQTLLLAASARHLKQLAWQANWRSSAWTVSPFRPRGRWMSSQGLSISTGPSEPPLLKMTIPEHFSSIVSLHGDRPAIISLPPSPSTSPLPPPAILTYSALDTLSNRLANSLLSLSLPRGARIAVSLGNGPEFAALTYAAYKLGLVLIPLNPTFEKDQVVSALRLLEAEVLVMGAVADLSYKPGRGRSNEGVLRGVVGDLEGGRVQSEAVPSLRHVVVVDNTEYHPDVSFDVSSCPALTPYTSLLSSSSKPITHTTPLHPSDVINIQFTSGTTSLPKAASLTHTSILNNGYLIAHRMGLHPTDRIVVPPPLFHCFGCILGYMATATTGAAICFPSPAFDPVATLRMCADVDATGLYGVATMFVSMFEALDSGAVQQRPKSLVKGIAAGSSVPESLMRKIYDKLGLEDLVICYGMTETSPVSCMTSPTDPFEQRTSSIGRVMPHTTVKIVDPGDRKKIVPIGEKGELATAGYLVMKGYFNDEARTAEVRVWEPDSDNFLLDEGTSKREARGEEGRVWMYSGDEASMDEAGYVRITGRIKDLIIRGGENIQPLEIENCIFQLPGVKEVSVVGVEDDVYGEAVAAFVVAKSGWNVDGAGDGVGVLTESDVRGWVRGKLSGHLVPRHVFWVDEYPKTASGKIQKFKLRAVAKELLSTQR